jgi:hypothetical protein
LALRSIAVIPALVGLDDDFAAGYRNALILAGVVAALGGVISLLTITDAKAVTVVTHVPTGPSCVHCDVRSHAAA